MRNKLEKVFHHTINDHSLTIKIKLADDCHNGHADFSITYDEREKDMLTGGYRWVSGGCFTEHNELFKQLPEKEQEKYLPFIRLHLSDQLGRPMYPISNPLYFLENSLEAAFMETCRVSEQEYQDAKNSVYDKTTMFAWFKKNGLFERWKEEADKAIAFLSDGANDFEYEITKDIDNLSEIEKGYEEIKDDILALMNKGHVSKVLADREQAEYDKVLMGEKEPSYRKIAGEQLKLKLIKEIDKYLNSPSRKTKFFNRRNVLKCFIFYDYDLSNLRVVFNWCNVNTATYQDIKLLIKYLSKSKLVIEKNIHLLCARNNSNSLTGGEAKAYKWLEDNNLIVDKKH